MLKISVKGLIVTIQQSQKKLLKIKGPLKTLTFSDIGNFFEAILNKHNEKQYITDNEKETFK